MKHYLLLDRCIMWREWITDSIGPFDSITDAKQWYSTNNDYLDTRGVQTVTVRVLVTPNAI